ncbi:MAG: hypothetical protein HY794_01600 [Desulfarculus sp.]|nr:hypothetical protein [Desulfarculus sp.]
MSPSAQDKSPNTQAQEHARAMRALVAMRQEAQALRFQEYWEPKVVAGLTSAAKDSQALLRQALAEYPRLPAGQANAVALRLWLGSSLAAMAQDKCAQAEAALVDMAREESRTLVEIITLHGLAAPLVDMEPQARQMAGGPALSEATRRAQRDFAGKLDRLLAQAWQREANPRALSQDLAKLLVAYQNRLKAIAVTTTHAVANRLRLAVATALDN